MVRRGWSGNTIEVADTAAYDARVAAQAQPPPTLTLSQFASYLTCDSFIWRRMALAGPIRSRLTSSLLTSNSSPNSRHLVVMRSGGSGTESLELTATQTIHKPSVTKSSGRQGRVYSGAALHSVNDEVGEIEGRQGGDDNAVDGDEDAVLELHALARLVEAPPRLDIVTEGGRIPEEDAHRKDDEVGAPCVVVRTKRPEQQPGDARDGMEVRGGQRKVLRP